MRTIKLQDKDYTFNLSLYAAQQIEQADWSLLYDKPVKFISMSEDSKEFLNWLITDTPGLMFAAYLMLTEPMDQDEFCKMLGGQQLIEVRRVVWQELVDFFPERATVLSKLMSELERIQDKAAQELSHRMPVITEKMDDMLSEELAELDKKLKEPIGRGVTSG